MAPPNNYFDIFKGTNSQWYWNLHNGGNHAIIATGGEGFNTHENALRAVKNFVEDVEHAYIPSDLKPSMAQDDILDDMEDEPTGDWSGDQGLNQDEDKEEPEAK